MGFVSIVVPYDDRWYFREILDGATRRITAAGHETRVHAVPPSDEASAISAEALERDLADPDCIGAVAGGVKYGATQTDRVTSWSKPVVVVGGSVAGFPAVMIDDIGAAVLATEHLLRLGHTRIVHFAGELEHQMDFSVNGRRARGYRLAMERSGLEPDVVENDFEPALFYRSALEVLAREEPPTAAFVVSDQMAYPVLEAIRDSGLQLGSEFSVTSVDDHPDAEGLGLTTVRQRPAEMGATAVDMLLSGMAHGLDPKQSRLAPITLVERASVGRPRRPIGR